MEKRLRGETTGVADVLVLFLLIKKDVISVIKPSFKGGPHSQGGPWMSPQALKWLDVPLPAPDTQFNSSKTFRFPPFPLFTDALAEIFITETLTFISQNLSVSVEKSHVFSESSNASTVIRIKTNEDKSSKGGKSHMTPTSDFHLSFTDLQTREGPTLTLNWSLLKRDRVFNINHQ